MHQSIRLNQGRSFSNACYRDQKIRCCTKINTSAQGSGKDFGISLDHDVVRTKTDEICRVECGIDVDIFGLCDVDIPRNGVVDQARRLGFTNQSTQNNVLDAAEGDGPASVCRERAAGDSYRLSVFIQKFRAAVVCCKHESREQQADACFIIAPGKCDLVVCFQHAIDHQLLAGIYGDVGPILQRRNDSVHLHIVRCRDADGVNCPCWFGRGRFSLQAAARCNLQADIGGRGTASDCDCDIAGCRESAAYRFNGTADDSGTAQRDSACCGNFNVSPETVELNIRTFDGRSCQQRTHNLNTSRIQINDRIVGTCGDHRSGTDSYKSRCLEVNAVCGSDQRPQLNGGARRVGRGFAKINAATGEQDSLTRLRHIESGIEDLNKIVGRNLHRPRQLQVAIDNRRIAGVDGNFKVCQIGCRIGALHHSLNVDYGPL